MIVYFSGTGNSRYCAQMMADQLGEALTDAFPYIRAHKAAKLQSDTPWVFVAPTYGWQLPHVFADFLRRSSFSGSREAYFVLTCGSDIACAGEGIEKLCHEIGFAYRGVLEVVMPENYIVMFRGAGGAAGARIDRSRAALHRIRHCLYPPRRELSKAENQPARPDQVRAGQPVIVSLYDQSKAILCDGCLHQLRANARRRACCITSVWKTANQSGAKTVHTAWPAFAAARRTRSNTAVPRGTGSATSARPIRDKTKAHAAHGLLYAMTNRVRS